MMFCFISYHLLLFHTALPMPPEELSNNFFNLPPPVNMMPPRLRPPPGFRPGAPLVPGVPPMGQLLVLPVLLTHVTNTRLMM